jgi:hypothetical protein
LPCLPDPFDEDDPMGSSFSLPLVHCSAAVGRMARFHSFVPGILAAVKPKAVHVEARLPVRPIATMTGPVSGGFGVVYAAGARLDV